MEFNLVRKLFLQRCVALQISDTTLKSYEEFLKRFQRFLFQQGIEDFTKVDEVALRQFLIDLSKTMNSITIESYYRKLKTLFNFLIKDKYLDDNPLSRVIKPKMAQRQIRTFTPEEVSKMLHGIDTSDFIGFRNYTILSLLLSTGLRRREYIGLTLLDVDFNTGLIHIIGKGDKERFVPIGNTLARIFKKYLKRRDEYMSEVLRGHSSAVLFISKDGNQLTISGSDSIFQELKSKLGMRGKKYSAHTWRHTFAKTFLLNGGDVFTLQKILGHSDITTTKVYINLSDNEMKAQNNKFNPLDNSRWQYY